MADGRTRRGLSALASAIIGAVVGIVIGATALQSSVERGVHWVSWRLSHGSEDPTCADPGYLERIRPVGATANKTFSDDGGYYDAKYTLDDDRTTAWIDHDFTSGVASRDAIAWQFASRVDIQLVCVSNGFQENAATYVDSGLATRVRIEECGPASTHDLATHPWGTKSSIGFEQVRVDCSTDALRLVVTAIESPHRNGQVALSEVRFYG